MEYCSRCGAQIENGSSFCPYCGATRTPATPPMASAAPITPTPYTTVTPAKSSGAGLGMAIPGMITAIIGFALGIIWFLCIVSVFDTRDADEVGVIVLTSGLFTMPFSIVGLSLSNSAKKNGYVGGMATTGIVLGAIGLGLHGLSFLLSMVSF